MKQIVFLFLVLVTGISNAQQVHLKTGNFSVKHSDLSIDIGKKLVVERIYNSSSNYKGIFGLGWTYDYTKSLSVNPDGSIVTKECECEGKTNNVFKPTTFDETAKTSAIEQIAFVVQSRQAMNPEDVFSYKQKLLRDRGFFMDEWKRLIDLKLLKPYEVPVNTKLVSKNFGFEVITKTADGYTSDKGGTKRFYNNDGQLIKEIQNGSYKQLSSAAHIELFYNGNKQLVQIKNNVGSMLQFQYNDDGLVKRIISSGFKKDTIGYRYQNGALVKVISKKGSYDYQYNYNNQLILIKHDEDSTAIVYEFDSEKRTRLMVKNEKDSTVYQYVKEPVTENEFKIEGVSSTYKPKYNYYDDDEEKEKKTGKELYELKRSIFYITNLSEGFQYNYRTINTTRGVTEDSYNNEEGYPDKIIKGYDTTTFVYNRFGEVTLKNNSKKREEVKYDPACAKISEYYKMDKENNTSFWTKFTYNSNCDLVTAENSAQLKVKLDYDSAGKISAFHDLSSNKVLYFKYNSYGKPIEISLPGEGSIEVTYDENGEIKKVDSKEGHKMALQVTQQFQTLLTVVKVDSFKPCKCTL
jgi:hypothetical protein